MEKITKEQKEIIIDHKMIDGNENLELIFLGYDKEIEQLREKSLCGVNNQSRDFYKKAVEELIVEKELVVKSSLKIINSSLRATSKWIDLCYPAIMNWNEKDWNYKLRTQIRPFRKDVIEELGKRIKSITCVCRDGVERTFGIKKIECYYGGGRKGRYRISGFVNVYFEVYNDGKN